MFDPAAMGTLIIGLRAIDADERPDRRRRQAPTPAAARRRGHRGIRVALANGLPQAAAALEPSAISDTAG